MRLTVRQEQMEVMEAVAQAGFERRVADHLRADYASSIVKLPDGGEFPVSELLDETLLKLVSAGIARARGHLMKNESPIVAFVALMFDVSPNFDKHRLCQVLLADEEHEPDERIGPLIDVLTDENWDSIRKDYDPKAWEEQPEPAEAEKEAKPAQDAAKSADDDAENKTVMLTPGGAERKAAESEAKSSANAELTADTVKPDKMQKTMRGHKTKDGPPAPDFGLETMPNTPKPDKLQKTMRGHKVKDEPSTPDFGLETIIIKRED